MAGRDIEDLQVAATDPARLDLDDDVVVGLDDRAPGRPRATRTPEPLKTAACISRPAVVDDRPGQSAGATEGERGEPERPERHDEHDRGHRVDLGRDAELDPRIDVGRQRRLRADREPGDDELVDRQRHADQRAGQDRRGDERQHDVPDAPDGATLRGRRRPIRGTGRSPAGGAATMSTTNGTVTTRWPGDRRSPARGAGRQHAREVDQQGHADQDARDHDRQGEGDARGVREADPRRGPGRTRPSSR